MSGPEDREISAEEFEDPLSNFEPVTHHDPLEKALFEQPVSAVESQPCAVIAPEMPVHQAVQRLVNLEVGCLVVVDEHRLVGVFTKRDVLDKVVLQYDEVKDCPVGQVMAPKPAFVYDGDPVGAALCVMASGGYRHVPVLDSSDRVVGVVGPIRVTAFLQEYLGH